MQWLFEVTDKKLEMGNKRLMEWGYNIVQIISSHNNATIDNFKSVHDAMVELGDKFLWLHGAVADNRGQVLACDSAGAHMARQLHTVQRSEKELRGVVAGMETEVKRISA